MPSLPARPPALFDGPLFPAGLTDVDLETLRLFGVEGALALALPGPAASAQQARLVLEDLLERQLPRLERAGIRAWAAVGLPPGGLPRRGLHEVVQSLPGLFAGGRAVALGPLGLERGDPTEREALEEQLTLAGALEVPVLVLAARPALLRPTVALLQASPVPARRVLLGGLDLPGARVALGCGFHAGLGLHPDLQPAEAAVAAVTGLGARRVVLGSHAGLGAGDLLALPRAAHLLEKARLSEAVIARVTALNLAALLRVPPV